MFNKIFIIKEALTVSHGKGRNSTKGNLRDY